MAKTRTNRLAAVLVLGSALFGAQVLAQEPGEADAPAAATVSPPNRLIFVEAPVFVEPGIDPVLPPLQQPVDPEADPDYASRQLSIRQYDSAVLDIESNGGAWDRSLVEELLALGNLQQQQSDHVAAIGTFDRAIHVNRINEGLHTLEQIPAVEQMIDSYIALGDWENADLYNNYLFYVQQKAYGANDPRIIPVLDRLANWNMQAFDIGYGESLGLRLSTAQILFNAAANMVDYHFGKQDERFVGYLGGLASTSYLVYRNPDLMAKMNQPDYIDTREMLLDSLNRMEALSPEGFVSGESALLQIVEFHVREGDSLYATAEAIANLADWYLIFGRRAEADQRYMEAWQVLSTAEDGDVLKDSLFGRVVPIPTFLDNSIQALTNSLSNQGEDALNHDYADVSVDVTPSGTTRRVRLISEETEMNSIVTGSLRSRVRNTRFRPVLEEGVPVRTDGSVFRYRYWY